MTEIKEEFRDRLLAALEPAEYHIERRSNVVGALPEGMRTRRTPATFR